MYINGHLNSSISAVDRGFSLGDGFFTTIHIQNDLPLFWQYHQQRLLTTAHRLGFSVPDTDDLYHQLIRLAQQTDSQSLCGKIVISRGAGGRGYSPAGCNQPTTVVSIHPYPLQYHDWQKSGIAIGIAEQRLGIQPILAGLKTLNRLEQVMLKAELDRRNLLEAVVLNVSENVVECVTANLFWRKNGVIYTPDLQRSGVCGVMRAAIMECCLNHRLPVKQLDASLSELLRADEVWISNALMGVVPVTAIDQQQYHQTETARWLQNEFEQIV